MKIRRRISRLPETLFHVTIESFPFGAPALGVSGIGGCHVTAKRHDLICRFEDYCRGENLHFDVHESVLSPDTTTLFTTSGMQKRKGMFVDKGVGRLTVSDSQRCLRLNDLDEIGDGTHFLDFTMLGLFSFRDWSPLRGVRFWLGFLEEVGVLPDKVTIHPSMQHHRKLYDGTVLEVTEDVGCVWSDGNIGGFCTEFYRGGVEIGNIVIPLGDCLDCGFGLERIGSFMDGWSEPVPSRPSVLFGTIGLLLSEGVVPGNSGTGYVLRKLVRICLREGFRLPDHKLMDKERDSRDLMLKRLPGLLRKHSGKSREFFFETFGIDPDEIGQYPR